MGAELYIEPFLSGRGPLMCAALVAADSEKSLRSSRVTVGSVPSKREKRMASAKTSNKGIKRKRSGFEPPEHPGYLVRRLHQICVSVFLDKASEYGLTHIQYAALQAVQFVPAIDQARLGRLIATDRQTTSNVVSRLTEKGLLQRKKKDKRTNALYLTGAAKALIRVMQPHVPEIDDTILKPLSATERTVFMRLLTKLVSANNDLSRAPQSALTID
jgi:DNA-binding MarR family transcriptional regulator